VSFLRYPFSLHMAVHIFVAQIIAPLLLLSIPSSVTRKAMALPATRTFVRLFRHHGGTWLIGIASMWLWHIPLVAMAAHANPMLHWIQEICIMLAGLSFWWPIVSPLPEERIEPVPWSILYLSTGCFACTVLGILIAFAPAGVFLAANRSDQQIGGLLMWVPGCLIYLTAIMWTLARWYDTPEEAAQTAPVVARTRG